MIFVIGLTQILLVRQRLSIQEVALLLGASNIVRRHPRIDQRSWLGFAILVSQEDERKYPYQGLCFMSISSFNIAIPVFITQQIPGHERDCSLPVCSRLLSGYREVVIP